MGFSPRNRQICGQQKNAAFVMKIRHSILSILLAEAPDVNDVAPS
jgi:hypothetical protein